MFAAVLLLIAAEGTSTGTVTITHEEIYVRAPRVKKQSAQISINAVEARRIPGTQGDTLKVVQNLPGVARAQLGSGQLIVWGAAPKDTRVLVDGLSVPALYHLGGLRSILSSELVRSIDLLPGAYAADYGRGLGGLVRVSTKPLDRRSIHAVAAVDVLDASAMVSVPITKTLTAAAAGRWSWLIRLLTSFDDDIGELFPIPRYADYQAKATLELRREENISLLFLGSHDRLRRTAHASDPKEARSDFTALDFHRVSLHYERFFDDDSSVSIAPGIGFDESTTESAFGGVPASLRERDLRYSLRASYRAKLSEDFTLALGLDAEGTRAEVRKNGSLNVPAREGDLYVFGRPPGSDVAADRYRVELAGIAPFAALEWQFGPLLVTPGLRLDNFVIDGERLLPPFASDLNLGFFRSRSALEPRIAAELRPVEALTFRAAGGIYHQTPSAEELSAVFAAPTLELSDAKHASIGATVMLAKTLSVEVSAYYKTLAHLVTRASVASPPLAHALEGSGSGRSFGAQLLIRKELGDGLSGWLSYAISKSERRDAEDGELRAFDFDQTHLLSAVASYQVDDWTFGTRMRFASGFPRSPIEGSYIDLMNDRYDPIFGAQNTARIPAFFQADLRVERELVISGAQLSIYLDLENLTFRKNTEELAYSFDYSKREPITGLPFLGVLGARLEL